MEEYLASIIMWPISWEPMYYSFCVGQSLSINQNQALYAVIGNVYGGTPQSGQFGLPDFRGRVPIGVDNVNYLYGKSGGNNTASFSTTAQGTITLNNNQLPAHNHSTPMATVTISIPANNSTTGNVNTPGPTAVFSKGNVPNGLSIYPANIYSTAASNTNLAPISSTIPAGTTGSTGTGAPIPIALPVAASVTTIQPWIAMNFMICTSGIFPQRQ